MRIPTTLSVRTTLGQLRLASHSKEVQPVVRRVALKNGYLIVSACVVVRPSIEGPFTYHVLVALKDNSHVLFVKGEVINFRGIAPSSKFGPETSSGLHDRMMEEKRINYSKHRLSHYRGHNLWLSMFLEKYSNNKISPEKGKNVKSQEIAKKITIDIPFDTHILSKGVGKSIVISPKGSPESPQEKDAGIVVSQHSGKDESAELDVTNFMDADGQLYPIRNARLSPFNTSIGNDENDAHVNEQNSGVPSERLTTKLWLISNGIRDGRSRQSYPMFDTETQTWGAILEVKDSENNNSKENSAFKNNSLEPIIRRPKLKTQSSEDTIESSLDVTELTVEDTSEMTKIERQGNVNRNSRDIASSCSKDETKNQENMKIEFEAYLSADSFRELDPCIIDKADVILDEELANGYEMDEKTFGRYYSNNFDE